MCVARRVHLPDGTTYRLPSPAGPIRLMPVDDINPTGITDWDEIYPQTVVGPDRNGIGLHAFVVPASTTVAAARKVWP